MNVPFPFRILSTETENTDEKLILLRVFLNRAVLKSTLCVPFQSQVLSQEGGGSPLLSSGAFGFIGCVTERLLNETQVLMLGE